MSSRMRILIGYDGSGHADAVPGDLRRAGMPEEAEALIVSVADVFIPSPEAYSYDAGRLAFPEPISAISLARERALRTLIESSESAQRAAELIQSQFPLWDVRSAFYSGSPARALIREADRWGADLVVVGAPDRSAFRRFALGSVSGRVVAKARCSVRVARARPVVRDTPLKLIIGVDGSANADAAVDVVASRSWPSGTRARVMMALDPSVVPAWGLIQGHNRDEWVWADRTLEASAAALRRSGLDVSHVIRRGDPKRVLLDEAERWQADCVFVGARGTGRVQQLLLGSVSAAVAARADCSVEVIRMRD